MDAKIEQKINFDPSKISPAQLIQMYPSDYTEMHEMKSEWSDLKAKLPQVLEYIKNLKTQKDEESLSILGSLSHNVGVFCTHVVENYPQALELLTIALGAKQAHKSTPDESMALTHAHLADCAYRNGDTVLALSQFDLADKAYQRKAGNKKIDLDRAFVLHASANAHYNIGAYPKAIELFLAAKAIRLTYLPEDHIDFGYLEHDYADVLNALGRYKESEKLFSASLEKKKKHFKQEDHTNIALLYQCRALMYIKSNQLEEARKNLELAFAIYSKHTEQFASENQPDLFRNYFYSILLRLAQGDMPQAASEIDQFRSRLELFKDKTNPLFVRLAQVAIRLFQHQDKSEKTIQQLEESLNYFIPNLNFESADIILTYDNKFDVAPLLSQYGVELYIQNNYQNFNGCLEIVQKALQLKQSFYAALPPAEPPLGTINYAFSDYDLGVLYYLSALASDSEQVKEEKLTQSAQYFQDARNKLILAGMSEQHVNCMACDSQLNKIKELLNPCKDELHTLKEHTSVKKYVIPKRVVFFPVPKQAKASEEIIEGLDTILRDYP